MLPLDESRCLGVRATHAGFFEHCLMRTQCERYLALNTDTESTWRDAWLCRTPEMEQRIHPQPRDWERSAMEQRGIKPIPFEAHGDSSAASMRDGEQCQSSDGVSPSLSLGSGCASSAERSAADTAHTERQAAGRAA